MKERNLRLGHLLKSRCSERIEGLVTFVAKDFQTITSSALRLENVKDLTTSVLDGHPRIGLNVSGLGQDLAW